MKYRDAGVDIDKAEKLVEFVKNVASTTKVKGTLTEIGGFAGLFKLEGYKNPVIGATCDGVGTKLKVAFMCGKHDTIGIDLVAMNANDLVTSGLEPLVFLDYFACSKIDETVYKEVIKGIVEGCKIAGCALIGGETAEMPGFYSEGEYDLAGFMIGACEESEIIPQEVSPGDLVVGLASSGLHSNGYSLARKVIFEKMKMDVDTYVPELGRTIGEELLEPTRIYVKEIMFLKSKGLYPKAVVHVTGGGLIEKPKRILGKRCNMILYKGSWFVPPIFELIKRGGDIEELEMYRTFNMGIGMLLVFSQAVADKACEVLTAEGIKAFPAGEITEGKGEVIIWDLK